MTLVSGAGAGHPAGERQELPARRNRRGRGLLFAVLQWPERPPPLTLSESSPGAVPGLNYTLNYINCSIDRRSLNNNKCCRICCSIRNPISEMDSESAHLWNHVTSSTVQRRVRSVAHISKITKVIAVV
jgi:hypothetical protein